MILLLIYYSAARSHLSVRLISSLKFNIHISFLKKKITYGVRILLKARHYFQRHTLLTLCCAFIFGHVDYCIASWGLTYHCHRAPLQHIQNVHIITLAPYNAHITSSFTQLNLLTLNKLNSYNHGILTYCMLNNQQLLHVIGGNSLDNPKKNHCISSCLKIIMGRSFRR